MELEIVAEPGISAPEKPADPATVQMKEVNILPADMTGFTGGALEHISELLASGKAKRPVVEEALELEPIPPDTSSLEGEEKRAADLRSVNTKLFEENRQLREQLKSPPPPPAKDETPPPPKPVLPMTDDEFNKLEQEQGTVAANAELNRRLKAEEDKKRNDTEETARIEKAQKDTVDYLAEHYATYENDVSDFGKFLSARVAADMKLYGRPVTDEDVMAGVERFVSDTPRTEKAYLEYLQSIGVEPVRAVPDKERMAKEKLSGIPMERSEELPPAYTKAVKKLQRVSSPTVDPVDALDVIMHGRKRGMF